MAASCANVSGAESKAPDVAKLTDGRSYFELHYGVEYNGVPLVGYEFGNQINTIDNDADPRNLRTIEKLLLKFHFETDTVFIHMDLKDEYAAFGAHLLNNKNHLLSLVYQLSKGRYTPNKVTGYENTGIRGSTELFGLRSTHYKGNYQLDIEFSTDVLKGNGNQASVALARFGRLGLWDADAYINLQYRSSEYTNFYVGVTPDQQSDLAPIYNAGRALIPGFGFGFSTALRDNWIFKTRYDHQWLPDSMVDSPLVKDRSAHILSAGFSYVLR